LWYDELLKKKKMVEKDIKDNQIRLSNKQKDIDIWEKKYNESEKTLKSIEEKGHPIDKQYERIKQALAKTLAKR